jgi:hypothetical protein
MWISIRRPPVLMVWTPGSLTCATKQSYCSGAWVRLRRPVLASIGANPCKHEGRGCSGAAHHHALPGRRRRPYRCAGRTLNAEPVGSNQCGNRAAQGSWRTPFPSTELPTGSPARPAPSNVRKRILANSTLLCGLQYPTVHISRPCARTIAFNTPASEDDWADIEKRLFPSAVVKSRCP